MPYNNSHRSINNPKSESRISLHAILHAARQEATGSKTYAYQITTILTGIILALIGIITYNLISPQNVVATFIFLSLLFALSFSPIRYAIEETIRQLFPNTDYNSHELIKRLNIISYSTLTRQELARQFFKDLRASINTGGQAFIFFDTHNHYVIKANSLMPEIKKITDQEIRQLEQIAMDHTHVVNRCPHKHGRQLCQHYKFKLLVPLIVNDKLTGILILGPKINQKSYTTKDIKVLNAIAPKVGYAIKNSLAYEKVTDKNTNLIKELQSANNKLRKANHQLRHDDKLKDEFVYIATHELKNPVTAMKGYLSLISEGNYGKIPTKLTTPLDHIKNSNNQLISLLNNLLQIARTEAQKLELKTKSVAICAIIDQVVKDLEPLIQQKKLTLNHSCKNPAISVMADHERLQEIINNLISNAIKYSDKGVISISHEIKQDKLVTSIKDHGVGISKEDQKQIFTRFFRVEEEAAKGIPGSGLGLFLVKQLIEKMGGAITFKSDLGKGSTFSIYLPLSRTLTLKKT